MRYANANTSTKITNLLLNRAPLIVKIGIVNRHHKRPGGSGDLPPTWSKIIGIADSGDEL
jgi:hypothetical protein